jgi:hypothetical protein
MLRTTLLALGASLAIGAAAADDAVAQSGRDRAEAAKRGTTTRRGDVVVGTSRRDDDRRWDDRDSDSDRRNGKYKNNKGRGNGPAFCRNGQGHPVHGREWCRQKGYNTGYGNYSRVDWGDVILRRGRYDRQRDLNRGTLQDILGSVVLGRFDRQRNYLGYSQPLYGRWSDGNDGSVLRLLSGSQTIGQIIDTNRDGRGDVILLYNGR